MGEIKPLKAIVNGKPGWKVDLRSRGGGRKFFASKQSASLCIAEHYGEIEAAGVGIAQWTDSERAEFWLAKKRLDEVGATIGEAVDFYLGHAKVFRKTTIKKAIKDFLQSRADAGNRKRSIQQIG